MNTHHHSSLSRTLSLCVLPVALLALSGCTQKDYHHVGPPTKDKLPEGGPMQVDPLKKQTSLGVDYFHSSGGAISSGATSGSGMTTKF